MRIVLLLGTFLALLIARENPFSAPNTTQPPSLITKELPSAPLRPELLRLPIDAVRVHKITVEYQNVDGTRDKRTFEIEKPIAQDIPLTVKQ